MSGMASQLESILDAIESVSLHFLFAVIALELLVLWVRGRWRGKRESWVSVACFALGVLPYDLFFALMQYEIMVWMYEHARIGTLGDAWYIWVLAYAAYDLGWWAVHFAAHKVRFLWCIHGAHHTPTDMNMSVAIRGSLLDFVQYVHLMIWLPILGFHPFMVLIVNATARLYGLFTHLHEDFVRSTPILDRVLITPSLHRVHHAKNPLYIDTNYANMFSFWDALFRTFQRQEAAHQPVFGVTDESIRPSSIVSCQIGLWQSLLRDMRSAPSLADKLKYLVMPPDWRPGDAASRARSEAPARSVAGREPHRA
jgi:sterol desaturase/sphingolipid hydroxylase (fatty acid hydroxylase superfamily)